MSNARRERLENILKQIAVYVNERKLRVANPLEAYTKRMTLTPQVKCLGPAYYYQTPPSDGSKIIAIWDNNTGHGNFSKEGFSNGSQIEIHGKVYRVIKLKKEIHLVAG